MKVFCFILERKCSSFHEYKVNDALITCIGMPAIVGNALQVCGVLFICIRVLLQPSFG